MLFKNSVDAVIPTLDGKKIYETINSLYSGKVKPKNTYCVYYKKFDFKKFKKFKNIFFIKSKKKDRLNKEI